MPVEVVSLQSAEDVRAEVVRLTAEVESLRQECASLAEQITASFDAMLDIQNSYTFVEQERDAARREADHWLKEYEALRAKAGGEP